MFGLFKRDDGYSTDTAEVVTGEPATTAEVHTPENPYCGNLSCWCHTNLSWHADATEFNATAQYPPQEVQEARRFFGLW